jgi:hypothetical protein
MSSESHPVTPEERTKQLLFEYEQLRKEILGNFTLGLQLLGGTVTFVAVIMTLAYSEAVESYLAKGALFFVGEGIAFVGLMQTMSLAHSTFQIASYLRTFTEPELKYVRWETRLEKFREELGKLPYEELTGSVRYTYAFIILVNYCLGSGFILWNVVGPGFQFKGFGDLPRFIWRGIEGSPTTGILLALTLLATLLLLRAAWRQYRLYVVEHDVTYGLRWLDIKAGENQSKPEEIVPAKK